MINISETQTKAAFSAEKQDVDVVVAMSCSCVDPTRMFWFTRGEIAAEVEN